MGRKDLRTVFVPLFAIVFLRLQNRDSESNLYLSSDFLHESCSWLPGSLIRSGWSTYSSAHPPSLLSVLLTFKYNIQESSRCGYLPQGQLLTRQETVMIIWLGSTCLVNLMLETRPFFKHGTTHPAILPLLCMLTMLLSRIEVRVGFLLTSPTDSIREKELYE